MTIFLIPRLANTPFPASDACRCSRRLAAPVWTGTRATADLFVGAQPAAAACDVGKSHMVSLHCDDGQCTVRREYADLVHFRQMATERTTGPDFD